MPYGKHEADDPMMLVGVEAPGSLEATRDMAYAFGEEFARMGFDKEKLIGIFQDPEYRAAHNAYMALGENEITTIVNECVGVWGNAHRVEYDASGKKLGNCSTCAGLTEKEEIITNA